MNGHDIRRKYPTFKAIEFLNEYWVTPDGINFGVYEDVANHLLGHVNLEIVENTYLGRELSEKYTLHIRQIIVCDELRGCGILGVICKRLIDAAEHAGVFIGGTARNFNASLPRISNGNEYLRYLSKGLCAYKKRKEEVKSSRSLLHTYLRYGFCRYDGAGYPMSDRRWKKLCFGYGSSKLEDLRVVNFLGSHLSC
jgi:hypothetical protein